MSRVRIATLKAKAIGQGCHFGEKEGILHGVSRLSGIPVAVPPADENDTVDESVAEDWLDAMELKDS